MKKFIWCFFKFDRYSPINESANQLILKCIDLINNCKECSVEIDYYEIHIKTSTTNIFLWNANKYYAWLNRGVVNGRSFYNAMPSYKIMYDFKKCLEKHGYNIHLPEPNTTIQIHDVKC